MRTLRSPFRFSAVILVSACAVAACGGSTASSSGNGAGNTQGTDPNAMTGDTSGGDTSMMPATPAMPPVDNGAPSTQYPAAHPAAPQLVDFGGSVLKTPRFVPVFFPNDPNEADLTAFMKAFPASSFYAANTTEYGVGAATTADVVDFPTAPATSISDTDVQKFITDQITAKTTGFDAIDNNTVIVLYYPEATTISLQGEQSCNTFGGYHDSFQVGAQQVAYAVVPRCTNFGGPGETVVDTTTGSASHEMMEASTDPHPTQNDAAYAQPDDAHAFWAYLLGGGEDGDMCAQFPGSFVKPADLGFTVQRSWSNKAAAAGHDPCVPQPAGEVYFNSAVTLPDSVDLGGGFTTKGIQVAVGASKTVEVDLFSDAATSGPWTVKAFDESAFTGGSPTLDFAWDRTTGVNGEKLHLTVTLKSKPQQGATGFFITSKLGKQEQMWLGLVAAK